MAIKYCNSKKVTKVIEELNFEQGTATINDFGRNETVPIYVDEYGRMYVRLDNDDPIYITEWDLQQHGLIDEELDILGLDDTYSKYVRIIESKHQPY